MTPKALRKRNLDGTNRRLRSEPDCTCFVCGGPAKLLRSMQHPETGKWTAGCEACFQEHQRVTCHHCGDKVKVFEWVKLSPMTTAMMCEPCAAQWNAVAAFVEAWNADFPRLARETVEALMAREFYALQRPALEAGDVIAMPVPEFMKPQLKLVPHVLVNPEWVDAFRVAHGYASHYGMPLAAMVKQFTPEPLMSALSDIERAALRRQTVEALTAKEKVAA